MPWWRDSSLIAWMGDLKSSNHTDWVAGWRGITASPDYEWGLTKRAVSLIVIATQGKDKFFRVDPPADAFPAGHAAVET
jgi:hypothetical protein